MTAVSLAGPRTVGTSWTYAVNSTTMGKSTQTRKVIGPVRIGKTRTVEIDVTAPALGGTGVTKNYSTLDANGLRTIRQTGRVSGPGFVQTTLTVPTPPGMDIPAAMKARKTYTYNWSEKTTTAITSPIQSSSTTVTAMTYTIRLGAGTTRLKTPAGTFTVFAIATTLTSKVNGVATGTVRTTLYVAAGVGQVKAVVKGADGSTSNIVLTRFVKAGGATSSQAVFSTAPAAPSMTLAEGDSDEVWDPIGV